MDFYFSGRWCNPLNPEYGLESNDVGKVAGRMINRVLTFEHNGIMGAVENVWKIKREIRPDEIQKELERSSEPLSRPVGKVVAADGEGRFIGVIDSISFPKTVAAIKSGRLSVSLTHADTAGGPLPLELSLVHEPARESARVLGSYKGASLPVQIAAHLLTMASENQVPEVSPLEAALALLPEDARSAIESKFGNYESSLSSKEESFKKLESDLEEERKRIAAYEKNAETDGKVLQQMIDHAIQLAKERDPDAFTVYGAPDASAFNGLSPEQSMAARQLVHACSKAMANRPATVVAEPAPSEEPATKRGRTAGTDRDALMRALQRKFD